MHDHQDPALRGTWKLDSAGRMLQWLPDATTPARVKAWRVKTGIMVWSFVVLCVVAAIVIQAWGLRIDF